MLTQEDINKLDVKFVEANAYAIVLDLTYEDKPIKRIEI